MENRETKVQLVAHFIEHMLSKQNAQDFLRHFGVPFKSTDSLKKLAGAYMDHSDKVSYEDACTFARGIWTGTDMDLHIKNLKSGLLVGHNWHKARPSTLHRSLQERVRECCKGDTQLQDLLNIGLDIMKQEYFIVATHDVCETAIIKHFADVVPPSGSKSVTDFVFRKTPVDLKVSTYPDEWMQKAGNLSLDEKKKLVHDLYVGADTERMRKQADGCMNNWGLNRLYVMVKNQEDWLTDPEALIEKMLKQLEQIDEPFCVNVNGFDINFFLVEV